MDDFGLLIGQYNATLPTLADGEYSEMQLTANGKLIIDGRWLAGTDAYASGDSGLSALAVRNDAGGALPGVADGEYTPLQVDAQGRLVVNAQVTVDIGAEKLEDAAHASGDTGNYILSVRMSDVNGANAALLADTNGDYQSVFTNDKGELYVKDTDALTKLTEIDNVLDAIKLDTAAMVIDLAAIEAELLEQGLTLDSIEADTDVIAAATKLEDAAHASGDRGIYSLAVRADSRPANANTDADGDYASFFVNNVGELWVKDADTLAQLVTIDAVLDSIKLDTAALASTIYAEDSGHTTADPGQFILAVRNDANAVLTDADLDYSAIAVDSAGRVKIVGEVTFSKEGTEAYTVTDALAAAGDGLETITAAGTPWVTVASIAVGAGTTAHIYGWQWACDQNAQARLVTDDTSDVILYKTTVNSSAQPGKEEHWDSDGRIEIAGAANLEIKLQIKKRSVPGGNANGTGSIHVRTV
jgi:hypothetical protein